MSLSAILANKILTTQPVRPSGKYFETYVELEVRDFLILLAKINVLHRVDYTTMPFGTHGSQEPPKYGVDVVFKKMQ